MKKMSIQAALRSIREGKKEMLKCAKRFDTAVNSLKLDS